jgi:glycosyltransferase involved in cell wall biosynthesis
MIGRFEPQKDHATFLAAARRFRASDPRAHFLLAGKGTEPDSPRFRAMCRDEGLEEDAVIGLGVRTDLRALYTACDLATLSSAYGEGTPNVVLEALACGVPVVATDVGDCRALIGPCGEVVPPRDPAALCAAWQRVLSRDLAAAARARAVTTFRDGVTTSTYDELLRGLLAAPSAAPGRTQAASEET